MLTNLEKIGRYLCTMYYRGELRGVNSELVSCVEKPLIDAADRRGRTAEVWRKLMSGDFAKLTTPARARVMGGRAKRTEELNIFSIDGGALCESEVLLYGVVGLEFQKLIEKPRVTKKESRSLKIVKR